MNIEKTIMKNAKFIEEIKIPSLYNSNDIKLNILDGVEEILEGMTDIKVSNSTNLWIIATGLFAVIFSAFAFFQPFEDKYKRYIAYFCQLYILFYSINWILQIAYENIVGIFVVQTKCKKKEKTILLYHFDEFSHRIKFLAVVLPDKTSIINFGFYNFVSKISMNKKSFNILKTFWNFNENYTDKLVSKSHVFEEEVKIPDNLIGYDLMIFINNVLNDGYTTTFKKMKNLVDFDSKLRTLGFLIERNYSYYINTDRKILLHEPLFNDISNLMNKIKTSF